MRRVLLRLREVQQGVTQEHGRRAEDTAHGDRNEDEPRLLYAEAVHRLEDVRQRGEEGEERGELAGDVEAHEGDDGLGEHHADGAGEGCGRESFDALECGFTGFGGEVEVSLPPGLEDGVVCFAREEGGEHGGDDEEEERPLRPAPAFAGYYEGAYDGAVEGQQSSFQSESVLPKTGSEKWHQDVDGRRQCALRRSKCLVDGAGPDGQTGGEAEPRKKAQDADTGEAVAEADAQSEETAKREADEVDWVSSHRFRERAADDWAQAEGEDVQR